MAKVVGYNGGVKWQISDVTTSDIVLSDATYHISSWSLDYTADPLDSTDFSSTGWRTFQAGLEQWAGSLEAFLDDGSYVLQDSDQGAAGYLWLYTDSTHYYHGVVIMTGQHPVANVDGLQTQTIDFQGTSDLQFSDLS